MAGIVEKANDLLKLVRLGHARYALREVQKRIASETRSVGLRRELDRPVEVHPPRIAIHIRRLAPNDDLSMLNISSSLSAEDVYVNLSQRRLLDAGLPSCWVAVTETDKPCYMQWLFCAEDNQCLSSYFGNFFPPLGPDEALLEAAYVAPAYRLGHGIGPYAMNLVTEKAREHRARSVMTFVREDNIRSLKMVARLGMVPFAHRHESWRMLGRSVRFSGYSATA